MPRPADVVLCVGNYGEGFQSEKVGFKQAELLDGRLCELRRESVLLNHHRDDVVELLVSDNYAAGVLAELAYHSLDDFALFKYVLYLRVVRDFLSELGGHFDRLFKSHFKLVGDHFCDGIGTVEGNAVYACQVAHDGLCAKLAVRHNVCDPIDSVLAADVFYDVLPPAFAEVNVKVRR